jgi:hypothetical protein
VHRGIHVVGTHVELRGGTILGVQLALVEHRADLGLTHDDHDDLVEIIHSA